MVLRAGHFVEVIGDPTHADVLTRAALHLTSEDWKAVKDAAPGGPDALLRSVPVKRFEELFAT